MKSQIIHTMDENIFDQFVVVDEKTIRIFGKCRVVYQTQFAAFEFDLGSDLKIKCFGSVSDEANVPLAQIIHSRWDDKEQQQKAVAVRIVTGGARTISFEGYYLLDSVSSVVIRILKKRVKIGENLCQPIIPSEEDDKLTVKINDKQIILSSQWLMSVSPVINRMLSVEMKEKQQRSLTLDDLDITMEQFKEFVEIISTTAFQILPNPKNVFVLLKLADFFQVDWLKSRCEAHLANCVEIPLFDRFLLIDRYHLKNFKNYFLNLGASKLRGFYKWNRAQLLPGKTAVSDELFGDLIDRLCG